MRLSELRCGALVVCLLGACGGTTEPSSGSDSVTSSPDSDASSSGGDVSDGPEADAGTSPDDVGAAVDVPQRIEDAGGTPAPYVDRAAPYFEPDRVLQVDIEIDPEDWELLRHETRTLRF